METLRSKLIKLAHTNPGLRPHLLPILKEASDIDYQFDDALSDISILAQNVLGNVTSYGRDFTRGVKSLGKLADFGTREYEPRFTTSSAVVAFLTEVNLDLDKALSIYNQNKDQTSGVVPKSYTTEVGYLRRRILSLMSSMPKDNPDNNLTPIISAETNFKRDLTSFSGSVAKYLMLLKGVEDAKIRKEVDNVLKVKKSMEDAVSDLSFAIGNYVTRNATGK